MTGTYRQKSAFYGVVEADGQAKWYVPAEGRGSAMTGDEVEVKVTRPARDGRLPEAKIASISRRGGREILCRAEPDGKGGWKLRLPDGYGADQFAWPKALPETVQDGSLVPVTVDGPLGAPSWTVKSVLPPASRLDWCAGAALAESGIRGEFPADALAQAAALGGDDGVRRQDWTGKLAVTIDGADAKDLDDAISVSALPGGGWELAVHIADVAGYVKEGSALDREALERGTSCYMPDRVVPMLPERLSNDLCSLNPDAPKRTLSAIIELTPDSRVRTLRVARTLIHSRHRLTYDAVQQFYDGKAGPNNAASKDPTLAKMLTQAKALAEKLAARRLEEGKVDFDLPELKAWRDADGTPKFAVRERLFAHKLIEEFMVLANEQVGLFFAKECPFIFRVHAKPAADGLQEAKELMVGQGLMGAKEKFDASSIPRAVRLARTSPGGTVVVKQLLRCMEKAQYSETNAGHFGLGLKAYSHFTSPIRRYPDLQAHRIILEWLDGALDAGRKKHYASILPKVSLQCGARERSADELENKVREMYVVEGSADKVGRTFAGIVSGVSANAAWVRMPDGAEGAAPLSSVRDYVEVDPSRRLLYPAKMGARLRGLTSAQVARTASLDAVWYLGKPVRVKVAQVDRAWGKLVLAPA